MERAGLTRPDDDRCDNLRWKGMFIDAMWDPKVPHGNDRAGMRRFAAAVDKLAYAGADIERDHDTADHRPHAMDVAGAILKKGTGIAHVEIA